MTVDVHCHVLVPEAEALVRGRPEYVAQQTRDAACMGAPSVAVNGAMFQTILPKLVDAEVRLGDMDAMGVDVQVISPSPTQYHYWADHDLARRLCAAQNDAVEALCVAHPQRFCALGAVALQHPLLAAAQLEKLSKRGFKGVQISTLVNGDDIADRRFDPFWQKAHELKAVVFIHPWGTSVGERLADHYLANTVGQPMETTICLSKLIFGGTLDRFPDVRIIAAHGGGYLPGYIGRSDHAHAVRPEAAGCACRPSDYLKRLWYDSIVYEPKHLERLARAVGYDRILIGTDYPFDMGSYEPARLVERCPVDAQRMVLGGNARELFDLAEAR
jgi:aminocarboxymuconate-semialdehyde decarboxylase